MGEVTQVKRVLRTELCGIGGSLFAFCFCFVFACRGFCASSVSRLLWGVWELFKGDTGNTRLCISVTGLT